LDLRSLDDYNSTGCRKSETNTISSYEACPRDFNGAAGEKRYYVDEEARMDSSQVWRLILEAKKHILWLFVLGVFGASCVPVAQSVTPTPTSQPEATVTSIHQEPTSTVFIGIPPISNPLVQDENESLEEFVARIAAEDISYSRPVLVALTKLENKNNLNFWLSSDWRDIQQCWYYETDINRECANGDLEKYFGDQTIPKILFAFAYSDSVESLFMIEHFYDGDERYPTDYYRLILELKDGKWVEKSILPGFW
jgi:hypothetical protein